MRYFARTAKALKLRWANRSIGRRIADFRSGVDLQAIAGLAPPRDFEDSIEVLVPCFNHGRYLREAFDSLLAQTWHGSERLKVTLIDDCSTDGSLAVMEELQRAHPSRQVEILRNEVNLNQAGALNRAVERSSSRLFVVLNADDILTPDCLELIVGTYRAHPQLMLAGGLSYPFRDGAPLPAHRRRAREDLTLRVYGPEDAVKFAGPNDLNISQSSSSFFRVAWEAVGGYWPADRRVCEFDDRDFQMRVCALFPVGVYEDYAMEFWRWGSSQGRTTI